MSSGPLDGRHAFVSGAGGGIGGHVARALADAGAAVTVAGRDAARLDPLAEELRALGARAHVAVADSTDAEGLRAAVAGAEEALGPLDVVVAGAGIAGPTTRLVDLDPADWDATLRTNLTGVFLLCRAALPGMLERGAGSVVVIGSVTGKRPLEGRTPYAASKAGLIGLVRTLAHEVGPGGVRVNLVSPGPVSGERFDRVVRAQADARGLSEDDVRAEFSAGAAQRRPVDSSEVAAVVTFLAGPASSGVTGEDLNVSAGLVMHG